MRKVRINWGTAATISGDSPLLYVWMCYTVKKGKDGTDMKGKIRAFWEYLESLVSRCLLVAVLCGLLTMAARGAVGSHRQRKQLDRLECQHLVCWVLWWHDLHLIRKRLALDFSNASLRLSKKSCRKLKNKKLHKIERLPPRGGSAVRRWGRVRNLRFFDYICLFTSRNCMQTELFRKSYLYAGLLPPRTLGTFLPEEGSLESHLLWKMTKVKF